MRAVSLTLLTFLAATATAGGVGLLTGVLSPPADLIAGSPFRTYAIPGLVLLVCVGGSAMAGLILVAVRHRLARAASIVSAGMIVAFEMVEISVIGSPAGIGRVLQALYIGTGVAIGVIASREGGSHVAEGTLARRGGRGCRCRRGSDRPVGRWDPLRPADRP